MIPWTVAYQAPLSMGFSSKNTGVGCRSLLQGLFATQGSKLHLLHWQVGSLSLEPSGKPLVWYPLVLCTQEYIHEFPVLRNTLAHEASPNCGLCNSLLRLDQFSREMVAKQTKKNLRVKKDHFSFQNSFSFFDCKRCMCVGLLLFSQSVVSNSLRPMD